ncbi:MAG: hypothetical protein ACLFTQ_03620 [Candidatus Aenigmatarchaeota archaeon]
MSKEEHQDGKNSVTEVENGLEERFLISEEVEFENLIDGAENLVKVRKESGKPKILLRGKDSSLRDRIFLYLLGAEISYRMGRREGREVTTKEVSEEFRIESKAASARISELQDEGFVRREGRGKYILDLTHADDKIQSLREKYKVK